MLVFYCIFLAAKFWPTKTQISLQIRMSYIWYFVRPKGLNKCAWSNDVNMTHGSKCKTPIIIRFSTNSLTRSLPRQLQDLHMTPLQPLYKVMSLYNKAIHQSIFFMYSSEVNCSYFLKYLYFVNLYE